MPLTPQGPSDPCPIVETIKTLSNKWSMIAIRYLLVQPRKFNQLKRDMGNVSSKTLSRSLKHLMGQGIVERRVLDTTPVSVEYSLTDKGRELADSLQAMARWGDKWLLGPMPQRREQTAVAGTRRSRDSVLPTGRLRH